MLRDTAEVSRDEGQDVRRTSHVERSTRFHRSTLAHCRDPLLQGWSDWVAHDGAGIPASLIGRSVWIAGIDHVSHRCLANRHVTITADYAVSREGELWDWSKGSGGISDYRVKRLEPLRIDADVVDHLDFQRRHGSGIPELMIGLDGVME